MEQGIKELNNFDGFENHYIKKYFPEYYEVWPQRIVENKILIRSLMEPEQKRHVNQKAYLVRTYKNKFYFHLQVS